MSSFTSFRQMLPSIFFARSSSHYLLRRMLSSTVEVTHDFHVEHSNIDVRICNTHDELDKCVRLQQQVWQFNDLDIVPRRVFIVTSSMGGVVLGAYESRHVKSPLLGFVCQYALSQNIKIMTGHFDSTDSKLAQLYIHRCHAIAKRYTTDYYGQSSSPLHKLSTDRVHLEWQLDLLNLKREDQFFPPRKLLTSDSDRIEEVHIPAQVEQWKNAGDIRAAKAQHDIYNKLTTAFERGLVILQFRLEQDGTGVYQLGYSTRIKKINE